MLAPDGAAPEVEEGALVELVRAGSESLREAVVLTATQGAVQCGERHRESMEARSLGLCCHTREGGYRRSLTLAVVGHGGLLSVR